jgi:hypothetical protein
LSWFTASAATTSGVEVGFLPSFGGFHLGPSRLDPPKRRARANPLEFDAPLHFRGRSGPLTRVHRRHQYSVVVRLLESHIGMFQP